MSDPTRIIVYRNPAEAALWESGMLFPIIASTFIGFMFAIMVGGLWTAAFRYINRNKPKRDEYSAKVTVVAFIVGMGYSLYRFGAF